MSRRLADIKRAEEDALSEWLKGNPVWSWRNRLAKTKRRAIHLIGCSLNSLDNWEYGLVRPNASNMAKIARAMQMPQIALEQAWTQWQDERPGGEE